MYNSELPRHNGDFLAAAWECWYGASDRACTVTAVTARWYYRTFLGAKAVERYEVIGQLIGAIACWVYAHVKIWVDAQVDANLPTVEAEAEEPAEVLTAFSTPLTFKDWVLLVVFKVRATILRFLHPQQTVANTLDTPQLQPCL